jgi:uncharacterized protein (DUF302 family)
MSAYGMRRDLKTTFEEALSQVPLALKAEGFGVLTEIDVQETLKKKLNVDFRRYRILGACNPPFARRALAADLEVGLLLPCNVVVFERDDGEATVMAVDPTKTMAAQGSPAIREVAAEVRKKLERALEKLV